MTEVKRQAALIKLTKDGEPMDLGAESPYLHLMLEHNKTKPEGSFLPPRLAVASHRNENKIFHLAFAIKFKGNPGLNTTDQRGNTISTLCESFAGCHRPYSWRHGHLLQLELAKEGLISPRFIDNHCDCTEETLKHQRKLQNIAMRYAGGPSALSSKKRRGGRYRAGPPKKQPRKLSRAESHAALIKMGTGTSAWGGSAGQGTSSGPAPADPNSLL